MPCYSIDGVIPIVDTAAFVHPEAVLIGDVQVGPGCYVGPGAVLRGDFGRIELARGANVQDTCVIHGFPDGPTVVGENGHVGHGAILHCCTIGADAMVGMNAVVMDGASVGDGAIVGACSFVPLGMQVPPRTLAAGAPARVRRELAPQELQRKHQGTLAYQHLARRSLATMREVTPLTAPEERRPKLAAPLDLLQAAKGG